MTMKYSTKKAELFEQIYADFRNDVYKIAMYYKVDEHVAQDITQRAFMGLYINFENTKPEKMRCSLFRSARNMAFNWLRDNKRLRNGQIEDLNDIKVSDISVEEWFLRTSEKRHAKILSDDIMMELYSRNKRWYEAIMLSYYMELPEAEVAARMNISPDVLYNRICRAKKWIRATYKEKYEEYLKSRMG